MSSKVSGSCYSMSLGAGQRGEEPPPPPCLCAYCWPIRLLPSTQPGATCCVILWCSSVVRPPAFRQQLPLKGPLPSPLGGSSVLTLLC